jgi:putative transposase
MSAGPRTLGCMADYRRPDAPGGTFFFTVVTAGRAPLLVTPLGRACLGEAWRAVRALRPFRTQAICLLPDHLHAVWTLPQGDADFSGRWRAIKVAFSRAYLRRVGDAGRPVVAASRRRRGDAGLWQRRFWEHRVRDEREMEAFIDYVHWNPVKHGLVESVPDWPWSSFHRYVAAGLLHPRWGSAPSTAMVGNDDARFGEPGGDGYGPRCEPARAAMVRR